MNPLEIKFIVQVELDNGMIITKDFMALTDIEAMDKAFDYITKNFKEKIEDIKVVENMNNVDEREKIKQELLEELKKRISISSN